MLRGCEYQILHTVSAWLDLRGEEVLFVEGAEDFDTIGLGEAAAVQVKISPAPISLGQRPILEALNNYWKLKNAAAGRLVRLKYLTRATFAVEQEKPFGSDVRGLDVWQRRPVTDSEVRQLRDYLAAKDHLDQEFRVWLKRASPASIRTDLVECVTWHGGAEESQFVERGIYSKLATFAEPRGAVPSSVTKQVARRLIGEVWRTLRDPAPRMLDFIRLEELWEEETRVSVPRSALDARWSERPSPHIGPPPELLREGIPPLPGAVVRRTNLVNRWRHTLALTGLLNLHGSTRTGKTTLAKLVASLDAMEWKWWSGGRTDPREASRMISMLVKEVARRPDVINVVLDDMDFSPVATHGMEEIMGDLLAIVEGRRGRVIVTSQKPLPGRLQHALGIQAGQVIVVPRLQIEEVGEFAEILGCTDLKRRADWAGLVCANTGGHPQLAAVRLLALRDEGWPELTATTFTSGTHAVEAEKADVQELLETLTPERRQMLQHLSVFPAPFRRDHAAALGALPDPIASPGTIFSSLVGPWIEPLHAGYFALSPLLSDGARMALVPTDYRSLQIKAAMILVEVEPRTTIEGASAFMLSWQARSPEMLTLFVQSWFDVEDHIFADLANQVSWFTYVSAVPGQRLFFENPTLSLFLRALQFRVAMIAAPQNATGVVEGWRWEVENSDLPMQDLQRMQLAGFVLPYFQVRLPARVVVRLLQDIAEALAQNPQLPVPLDVPREDALGMEYLPHWEDTVSTLSFFVSQRCTTLEFLDEFLTALESVNALLRERILRGFVGGGIEAQMAIDHVWLAESDKDNPNWERCLALFERALTLGRAWACIPLAGAALRGISTVLDEYIKDHGRAHQALNRLGRTGDLPIHLLHDRRACVFFSEENYLHAEAEWKLALASWPRILAPFDSGAVFAARSAGICAARSNRWVEAANWFKEIIVRVPTKSEVAMIAGANGDAGYCFWKAGLKADAVAALIDAWELASTLPSGRENLRAFIRRKCIGHVIAWLYGQVRDEAFKMDEPIAGVCSSAEMPEKMRDLPETDNANVWLLLIEIERKLGTGNRAAQLGERALADTGNPITKSISLMQVVAENLQSGELNALPQDLIQWATAMNQAIALSPAEWPSQTNVEPMVFQRNDGAGGACAFIAALVSAHAHGQDWRDLVKKWRAALPVDAGGGWLEWFDTIETVLGGSTSTASRLVREKKDWPTSMLAAWHLLISSESVPDDLFYGHARWLGEIRTSRWLSETGSAFCQQVEVAWGITILTPALLRLPSLSIANIRIALLSGQRGIGRAARILLAASTAVSVRLGPTERFMRNLAEGE